jgi:beta-lactam-binding protein with PASTA domain
VTLTVAEAPVKVTVPNVVGATQASAESQLTALNLAFSITPETVTDPSQQGIVQSQSPTEGYVARVGKVVTLVVGNYQAPGGTGTSGTTGGT